MREVSQLTVFGKRMYLLTNFLVVQFHLSKIVQWKHPLQYLYKRIVSIESDATEIVDSTS